MKLNPQQAPLYGRCVITVQLSDEELAGDEEGVDYFLLFAGSTQRHLTSTLRSSHDTLQALCPAHDCCEVVLVTLCSAGRVVPEEPEDPDVPKPCVGRVAPLAEHRFSFVQDLAFDMAQFLVSTAGRDDGLDGALLLDECQIPLQECERLDESLALALHHLALPPGWSLLGNKLTNNTDLDPQETLLHFSARRGLFRVTHFLLQRSGAREALRLANRQGHTPLDIAAQRGNERLLQLLKEAEADTETDKGTEPVSTDARVFCHLPRLCTHTLTLRTHPGRDPPTLQRSVEQLLHLVCHLHAKGVSVLELQFDSLHTAAECCDGVETETTCPQRLSTSTECLNLTTEEICSVESSSSVDCGHGETGNEERAWSLSLSSQKSGAGPREYGLGPPEDWVCLSSNIRRDYCRRRQRREQPGVSSQSLRLCEGERSEADGESLTVGIQPPAGCSKQAEETDSGEAAIGEGLEATEGEERSEQEAEDSTAGRREEETNSTDLITPSGDTKALVMGQSQSLEDSEASETSDSEMKDCCHEGENIEEEEIKLSEDPCDGLFLEAQEAEAEEFSDPLSPPRDLPSPSLIDSGDVIEEPESVVPCLLIEGLHEGEPPPDINSLEQNQETAGRDYSSEQQRGSAPQTACHSGNCTGTASSEEQDGEDVAEPSEYIIERTILPMYEPYNMAECEVADISMEETRTDPSPEPSSEAVRSSGLCDLDSGMTQSVSSDDDGSFRSVASSTTEIFHPTQDSAGAEDEDSTGSRMDEPNDSEPVESNDDSVAETGCSQTGTEPGSPSPQTMEALYPEGTGDESAPELSKEDHLGQGLAESGGNPPVDVSEPAEAGDSELNAGFEDVASEVNSPSGGEESDKSTLAPSENSGDVQLVLQQPKQGDSEVSPDFSISQDVTLMSDGADSNASDVEVPPSDNEASSEPHIENESTDNTEIHDEVDGASPNHSCTSQEAIVCEQTAADDESVPAEETGASTFMFCVSSQHVDVMFSRRGFHS
ncbi:uncharacterized protein LKV04_012273 [Tautogolabrus adspersus]